MPLQQRMLRYTFHCFHANEPLAKFLMPVLVRSAGILTVIEVDCFQPVKTDHIIKVFQNPVEVINQIISGIPGVAGIETNAKFLSAFNTSNDLCQFFERSAYRGSSSLSVSDTAHHAFFWQMTALLRLEDTHRN